MDIRARPRARLRAALAWRPDWPVLVLVAVAWVVVALSGGVGSVAGLGEGGHGLHGGGSGAQRALGRPLGQLVEAPPAAAPGTEAPLPASTAAALGGWAVMSTAMMTPVALPMVRHVAFNTIRERRRRAVTLSVASYLSVWVALGAPALAIVAGAHALGASHQTLVLGALLLAAGWELTRWKRRALNTCRRTVALPPSGWSADLACLRFGLVRAGPCVVSCWALMLVMAATGHASGSAVLLMAGLSALVVIQAKPGRNVEARRRLALRAATFLALAAPAAALTT